MRKRAGRPWRKGQSGNPSGRPAVVAEIRDACRKHGSEAVRLLMAIARDRKTGAYARVAALREILDRGFGRVVSQHDLHLFGNPTNADGGEVIIELVAGPDGSEKTFSLNDLAADVRARDVPAAPAPTTPASPPLLEDMRRDTVARAIAILKEDNAKLEAEIERRAAEIKRKQRIASEREPGVVVLDLDE
jgi:hypothetical protein